MNIEDYGNLHCTQITDAVCLRTFSTYKDFSDIVRCQYDCIVLFRTFLGEEEMYHLILVRFTDWGLTHQAEITQLSSIYTDAAHASKSCGEPDRCDGFFYTKFEKS